MSRPRTIVYAIASLLIILPVTTLGHLARVFPEQSGFVRALDTIFRAGGQQSATVSGQVTFLDRDRGLLFLQSPGGAWRVETAELDPLVVPGVVVEASGIVSGDLGVNSLQFARLRSIQSSTPLKPLPIGETELSSPNLNYRFVALTGVVTHSEVQRADQADLIVHAGKSTVQVRIADWVDLNPTQYIGAKVRIEGVLENQRSGCGQVFCTPLVHSRRPGVQLLVEPAKRQPVPNPTSRVLTTVSSIRALSPDEASRQTQVRLEGIVTMAHTDAIFLQDRTGGIYVDGSSGTVSKLRAGQRIVLTGKTGPGQFAPIVMAPLVESVNAGTFPKPDKVDVDRVLSGLEDSNWIEIEGIVRSAKRDDRGIYLNAQTNGVTFQIRIDSARRSVEDLIDTKVRLQGVCGSQFNLLRQLTGVYVATPSLDFIHPQERQRAISSLSISPISDFGGFSLRKPAGHRERIQGVVTYRSSLIAYVQDSTGSLKIQPSGAMPEISVGDRVEAIGFPTMQSFGPAMVEGVMTKLSHKALEVRPRFVSAEDVIDQGIEGELVSIVGTLSDHSSASGEETLTVHSGSVSFVARLTNQHVPVPSIGSLVRLTGIPVLRPRAGHPFVPGSFVLLAGKSNGIVLVRAAPWWNAASLLCALAVASLSMLFIAVWAIALRQQVRSQTRVIRTQLDEAQALRATAESAARTKSDFLANMSHEIRTPLNGILGMTELALLEPLSVTVRDHLETVRTSGGGLLQIINDILDLSKIEAGRLQIESIPFNLEATIREASATLYPATKAKGLQLQVLYSDTLPCWYLGDPLRIRQVVLNLLSNAVKFTRAGTVAVEISSCAGMNTSVRIEVRDTGVGIPIEKQAGLFESFTQADSSTTRQFGGTGLGLTISKRLVQMMGGTIGFLSEPGRGSTFWFEVTLPLAEAPAAVETASAAPAYPVPLPVSSGRVLLAEDNAVNRKLASKLLERMGYEVYAVEDGYAAVDAAQRHSFVAIFMDCQMPACDGYAATSAIRQWENEAGRPRTPIIALTAHAMPGDRERCLASGMDDHLTKPLQLKDLHRAVQQQVAQRNTTLL